MDLLVLFIHSCNSNFIIRGKVNYPCFSVHFRNLTLVVFKGHHRSVAKMVPQAIDLFV
jgi:hypothetical protein